MSLRPYSRSGIPSVTQVINCFSIEDKAMAMSYSAANITAESGDRREFRTRWDRKRLLGTRVHAMAVDWAAGNPVDSDDLTDPYMDGLASFYDEYQPEWLHLEQTVGYNVNPRRYVGSFDAIAEIRGEKHLIDLKTTGRGIETHLIDWTLQLSAYRWAGYLSSWEDGTERMITRMPSVAHTSILWLKDDGSCELVDVPTSAASFTAWLQLWDIWSWAQDLKRGVKTDDKDRHPKRASRRTAPTTQDDNGQRVLGV